MLGGLEPEGSELRMVFPQGHETMETSIGATDEVPQNKTLEVEYNDLKNLNEINTKIYLQLLL